MKLEKPTIVAVFAHPGDEIWISGTMALISLKYPSFQIVYATSGETGGDVSGRGLNGEALARERELEAHSALETMGICTAPIFLRLPDSGLNLEENEASLQEKLNAVFGELSPELILSFGEDGITGDKDHQVVGIAARKAADMIDSAVMVLNIAVSCPRRNLLQKYAEELGLMEVEIVPSAPINKSAVDLCINVTDFVGERIAAMTAHKTRFSLAQVGLWEVFVTKENVEELVFSRYHNKMFQQMNRIFSDKEWSESLTNEIVH